VDTKLFSLMKKCPSVVKEALIRKNLKAGEKIIEQGDNIHNFYVVLEGSIKVYYTATSGKSHIQNILEKGDIFGELEVLQEKPSICNVEAINASEILVIPRSAYRMWLEKDFQFSLFINELICNKFYLKTKKISEDILYPLSFRLVNHILFLHEKHDSDVFEVSKSLIADELATSVRSLNRLIMDLNQRGLIDYEKNKLRILDYQGLRMEKERYL